MATHPSSSKSHGDATARLAERYRFGREEIVSKVLSNISKRTQALVSEQQLLAEQRQRDLEDALSRRYRHYVRLQMGLLHMEALVRAADRLAIFPDGGPGVRYPLEYWRKVRHFFNDGSMTEAARRKKDKTKGFHEKSMGPDPREMGPIFMSKQGHVAPAAVTIYASPVYNKGALHSFSPSDIEEPEDICLWRRS